MTSSPFQLPADYRAKLRERRASNNGFASTAQSEEVRRGWRGNRSQGRGKSNT